MRAEFFRSDDPQTVVGAAIWDGTRVRIESDDEEIRAILSRVFRPSPVAVEDPSTRPRGSRGATVVEPGDRRWFLAAAGVRGQAGGLGVRFVTERPGGWDPAGAYRPMDAWEARRGGGPTTETLGTPSQ